MGEVNVVTQMKNSGAVIGGEGNGGVIYPASHYGRDALVGVALPLLLAHKGKKGVGAQEGVSSILHRENKIQLTPDINVDAILEAVEKNMPTRR